MNLSVMSPVLNHLSLEEALKYLGGLGIDSVEMGVGGYPGKAHVDAADYLANPNKIEHLKELLRANNLKLSGLACHGNPVHPNKDIAEKFHNDFIAAARLAPLLDVDTIIGFSGCPGDCESSQNPNWVTCAWPNEYRDILDWQWNDVIIPYWKKTAETAEKEGVTRIAFEMHPGFCVYNPSTLMKLRNAVGETVGANFDPSHLFWQGIDPCEAIKYLGDAIYHVHAKDTKIDGHNTSVNGVLDVGGYGNVLQRSWVFRTVGYGHGEEIWRNIISALKAVGYDRAISIEHEDGLMSPKEGLEKAVEFLKQVLIYENPGDMWWV